MWNLMLAIAVMGMPSSALAVDYTSGDYAGADISALDGDTISGELVNVGSLRISGVVTVPGGSVVIAAAAVTIDGTLDASARGNGGGSGGTAGPTEGNAGGGVGAGEGGGPGPCVHGGGGGGGGFGGAGGVGGHLDGPSRGWGEAGGTYGDTSFVPQDVGSGGGGGGGACDWDGYDGGAGGGSVFIDAGRVVINGSINANGGDGTSVTDVSDSGGPGGGGSGGAVVIVSSSVSGAGFVDANGGNGGDAVGGLAGGGGGGGGGRVNVSGDLGTVSLNALGGGPGLDTYDAGAWPNSAGGEGGVVNTEPGVAGPVLDVAGSCPGEMTFTGSELTAGGSFALLSSSGPGGAVLPGGPCGGAASGLSPAGLTLRIVGPVDPSGMFEVRPSIPLGACGAFIQVVDLATCTFTGVESL